MYSIVVKYSMFELRSYGMLLAISFISGIYLALHRARKGSINCNYVKDLSIIIVLCNITGSRCLYVITHLNEFKGYWLDVINPIQSSGYIGIAGIGGMVFSLMALIVYCLIKRLSVLKMCDLLTPSFVLGSVIGRIGCCLNGCCFGKPCHLPWCSIFPADSPAEATFPNISIHPTQLYSSLYGLILFVKLLYLDRKERPDGFLISIFWVNYSYI